MNHRGIFLPLCLLLAWPIDAGAGIYNAQSILAAETEDGFSGSLSAATDWRTGNIDFFFVSGSALGRYRTGDHMVVGIAQAEHKTSRGTRLVTRFFEHLRYRYAITERFDAEVFGQHEFDAVKRLELRSLVGVGPRFDIVADDAYGLGLGVAFMSEYERLRDDMEFDAGISYWNHRVSSYLVGRYELNSRVSIFETIYAQPRVDKPSDWRLLSDLQVSLGVTKRVSVAMSFTLAYDSAPPATIRRVDTALISSLAIEL